MSSNHIILFDGACNLCNDVVRFIIKRDLKNKFKFASLQSAIGQRLLVEFSLPTKSFDTFAYVRYSRMLLRSDGALYVLRDLGYPWKLLFIFIVVPRPIRDWIYNFISQNRINFRGSKDICLMPSKEIMERFLE